MKDQLREGWSEHIDQIIRSKHYTWLGEGLAGEALPEALACMLTDIMHICKRQNLSFDDLLDACRKQFVAEETSQSQ